MSAPKTILVAYDDPRTETLGRAADLAEALGSSLIVTTVAASADGDVEEEKRSAHERLNQARTYIDGRGLVADFVPAVGHPAEAIVDLARRRNADLIVVGTRRKGFFERLVEGSVNQEVLRRAPCDVLVVY